MKLLFQQLHMDNAATTGALVSKDTAPADCATAAPKHMVLSVQSKVTVLH